MSDSEKNHGSYMTHEDLLVVDKMNELVWNRVITLTPEWSQGYLEQFKVVSIGPNMPDEYSLELLLAAHVAELQREGLIPDFFSLRNEAMTQLGLPPVMVDI